MFFILTIFSLVASIAISWAEDFPLIENIKNSDRILILAPHPDDEAIGCAGVIQEAVANGAKVKVAYLTSGENNEVAFIVYEKRLTVRKGEFLHMGEVRQSESIEAMKLLGIDKENLIFLGYPDFGTFKIFTQYWNPKKPFWNLSTRTSSVPYKVSPSYGAPYSGESILADLKKILLDFKPTKVFVSHPADVNVDHKALNLFLEVALLDLGDQLSRPKIYPYLIHCVGWPLPRHYHPELPLDPPNKFLNSQIIWNRFDLSPERLNKKHQAILCYKSQTETSAFYLLSFARKNELFGEYPFITLDKHYSLKGRMAAFSGYPETPESDEHLKENSLSKDDLENKSEVSFSVLDGNLVMHISKPKSLINRFATLTYLFGYSKKVPFAEMPKLLIITKFDKFKIINGKKIIKVEGASLEFLPDKINFKIPLKALGDPGYIITSVKAYLGKDHGGSLSIDAIGFRTIEIK